MINFQCDICNKKTTDLKTIILNKKTIDYCPACKEKVNEVIDDFRKEIKQEYILYEERLRQREVSFFKTKFKKFRTEV